jgi:hypothetical protein
MNVRFAILAYSVAAPSLASELDVLSDIRGDNGICIGLTLRLSLLVDDNVVLLK